MDYTKLPKNIYCKYKSASHVQGVAVDIERGYAYVSLTTVLVKITLNGEVVGSVDGLTGHLGCISFNAVNNKVYGSIEYKHDVIGKGIINRMGARLAQEDAFYIAIFDCDKITREGMSAEEDGVMVATYLPDVVEDYSYDDGVVQHRYGCSGIDGTAVGYAPCDKNPSLMVAYGIYGDNARTDNDNQVILKLDLEKVNAAAKPLTQLNPHHSGVRAQERFFVHTGNTRFGVQNLEYDSYTGDIFAAVYHGAKQNYPNYHLFRIDGSRAPETMDGGSRLFLAQEGEHHAPSDTYGYYFDKGATGLCAIGEGYYYISHDGRDQDGTFFTRICLYKYVGGNKPFELVI